MQINFYATLRPIVGGRSVTFDMEPGITVREMIDGVVTRFPLLREQLLDASGDLYPHVHIFINGRDAPYLPDSVETRLRASDTIDIFPATAGG